ncbi:rhamnulokinase family protein [uncultured Tyzzerella sp.]|uniref:rhamnulokinase n=1 Tax=uncultured Tyzzerella sp. TaxID=2321398 RepID=UPI002943B109|nr:rhamnulokinase family protein [uncultured Tyzzerella sp.]
MSNDYKVLAIDFGASSGRAIIGNFKNDKIEIQEIHRFSNDPVKINNTMYWDFLRLFFEIKQSLIKSKKYGKIESMGIDTWGVDFGALDKFGNLLENPVHYRDERTDNILEDIFKKIDKEELYNKTGNQIMNINTAFQLFALKKQRPDIFERIDKILLMPDLFNYFFTGKMASEVSIASTTQIFDPNNKKWAKDVIEKLDLKEDIFANVVSSGTTLAPIKDDIAEELDIHKFNVVAIAGHDTQSAVVAIPTEEDDFIFLSCGTWSLMGTELDNPIINEKSIKYNITNEIGYEQKTTFLKNIIGLWLIQESKRQWEKEGNEYSFSELEKMASDVDGFKCFIDPDDEIFIHSGNIPKRIKKYCKEKFGTELKTVGEIVRTINESLAFKYKSTLEEIEDCTGKKYDSIYMIGGGVQSNMLCQMTANACGCTVYAGPIEATVLGNISIQLITNGKIENIKQARKIIKNSENIKVYEPKDVEIWQENYKKFKMLF